MNATSFVRPVCWILGAPLMLIALAAAVPADADGANPGAQGSPVAAAKKAPPKKSVQNPPTTPTAPKSSLGKHTKKHHKHHHKHKKHHKHKHGKKGMKGKSGRTSANSSEATRDLARVERDEATLSRDMNQLKRALR